MAVDMTSGLCIGASFCCSLTSLVIFVYSAVLLAAYTPIYRKVECISMGSEIGDLKIGLELALNGTTSLKCFNPNPYVIGVSGREPGEVYTTVDGEMKRIGYSYVQDSEYPSEGSDIGTTRLELLLPSEDMSVAEALPLLLSPEVTVISELLLSITVSPSFYGMTRESRQDGTRWCGFRIRDFGKVATRKVGPSSCAKTLEELVMPGVDAERKASFIEINEETLASSEMAKNGFVGGVMAATAMIGVATAVLGIFRMRRAGLIGKQAREVGLEATKPASASVDDNKPEVNVGEKAQSPSSTVIHLGEDTAASIAI